MSNTELKAVQHGLRRKNTGKMQSLWFEIPGRCNLACSYCFVSTGEVFQPENLLKWEDYVSLLKQAKALGVDSVGIPGAGEPLLKTNKELTMKLIRKCAELGFYVTLFTTGELIDEKIADELYELPVEIMIKCNTLNPDKQDKFVSDLRRGREIHGYGAKRNAAFDLLIKKGFNDEKKCKERFGHKTRVAAVTSVMTSENGSISNLDDIAELLRYCRNNNIIFDADTILKKGRGATCGLCASEEVLKAKILELQKIDKEEYDNEWEMSTAYIGEICDRYMHHLYVDQYGNIRPCLGAMDVKLGNIRNTKLEQAWQSQEMKIIRDKKYIGKCGEECAKFERGECNSCLGRWTEELNNEQLLRGKAVKTAGCWNFENK